MDLNCFTIYSWLLAASIIVTASTNAQVIKATTAVSEESLVPREQAEQPVAGHVTEAATTEQSSENVSTSHQPQIKIMEPPVNGDEIEKPSLAAQAPAVSPQGAEGLAGALVDNATGGGEALSDEDINKFMQIISPPANESESIAAKTDAGDMLSKVETAVDRQEDANTKVEPRTSGQRGSRALRPHGFYILALAPIDGPVVPTYTKLDIIPAERALDGDMALRRATKHRDDNDLMMSASEVGEARLLSKKKLNRYVRRLMKQIRKGTRKIQRKTRKLQKKKKASWFSW